MLGLFSHTLVPPPSLHSPPRVPPPSLSLIGVTPTAKLVTGSGDQLETALLRVFAAEEEGSGNDREQDVQNLGRALETAGQLRHDN